MYIVPSPQSLFGTNKLFMNISAATYLFRAVVRISATARHGHVILEFVADLTVATYLLAFVVGCVTTLGIF